MPQFNDEHSGKGGSYVAKADGTRELQARTDHAAPEEKTTKPGAAPAPAASKRTTPKGVSNA